MKERNATKDVLLVVGVVVFGKIIGFARELIVAYLFGSSYITDAFYFSNGLITSMLAIITMGLGQAYTPLYLDTALKRGDDKARQFTNRIMTILLILGLIVSIVFFSIPEVWLKLFGSDLNQETLLLASEMLRIMAFCLPIYIAFSIRKCILNANQKYIATESSGIPYSIAICVFIFILFPFVDKYSLPISAIVGIVFQFVFVFLFSKKNYLFRPSKFSFKDPEIKAYFKMLIPIFACAILEEANGLLRKSLAGGLGDGSIANLSYCMTLTTLINGIVITSISTVYFPSLIKCYSEERIDDFKKNMSNCLSMASFLVLPVVLILLVCSKDVVRVIYERGNFTSEDTEVVSSLFSVYVIGSIVYAYRCIIRTAFYSTKNAKIPMINEIVYLVVCIGLNVLQVKVFKMGLVSLGIAWVASITLATPVLFIQFQKKYFRVIDKNSLFELLKSIVASAVAVGLIVLFQWLFAIENKYLRLLTYAGSGFAVYLLLMVLLRSSTIQEIKNLIIKKKTTVE